MATKARYEGDAVKNEGPQKDSIPQKTGKFAPPKPNEIEKARPTNDPMDLPTDDEVLEHIRRGGEHGVFGGQVKVLWPNPVKNDPRHKRRLGHLEKPGKIEKFGKQGRGTRYRIKAK